jgi:acetyl esterase/lipase
LDVKAAVRFLLANAATYSFQKDKIAVLGSSAGGHLAALVALTPDNPIFEDAALDNPGVSTRVQALVNWFGPTELLRWTPTQPRRAVRASTASDMITSHRPKAAGLVQNHRLFRTPGVRSMH